MCSNEELAEPSPDWRFRWTGRDKGPRAADADPVRPRRTGPPSVEGNAMSDAPPAGEINEAEDAFRE